MRELYFSNVVYDINTYYIIYVGELKTHYLNEFVLQAQKKIRRRKVAVISIVPDVLEEYPFSNVIVVNSKARESAYNCKKRVASRCSLSEFASEVSRSPFVRELVETLVSNQGELFVWMYESRPELTLTDIEGITLLGPDPELAQKFNNKTWQYEQFSPLLPVVDFRVCRGEDELYSLTDSLRECWEKGIFISHEYSAAGMGSMITTCQEEVLNRFSGRDCRFLVSRYMPHEYDPTVLAVVANEEEVYIAGVADQRIENGNSFRGSIFPSRLPSETQVKLAEYTRIVGRQLAKLGYRGIFGCDYIVDTEGDAYFIEVNTRKQGTTMEFSCTLAALLPEGCPSLMELEYFAVTEGSFPENTLPRDRMFGIGAYDPSFYWGTYNFKTSKRVMTSSILPQRTSERKLFQRLAETGEGGSLFLEHVGTDVIVEPNSFVGRVVAVGSTREEMLRKLHTAERLLRASVDPYSQETERREVAAAAI